MAAVWQQRGSNLPALWLSMFLLLPFLPETGHEEEEDSEDLQTAYQHIGTHQPFAGCRNVGKVTGGASGSCGRTYVAEHTDTATQSGIYIGTQKAVAKHGYHHQNDIKEDKGQSTTYPVVRDNVSADSDAYHGSGVQLQDKLLQDTLGTYQDSYHLYTTSRTTCTGSDGHNDNRWHPEGRSPSHIIELLGSKARTGHYTADMEKRRAEGLFEAYGQSPFCRLRNGCEIEEQHEAYHGKGYDGKEGAKLLVLEECIASLDAQVIIKREVNAAEQHKHTGHIFDIRVVEVGHTLVMGTETTRSYGSEAVYVYKAGKVSKLEAADGVLPPYSITILK